MTKKERVRNSLQHQKPDIVPYQISFTLPIYQKLSEYFHDQDFIERIGNHLAEIGVELGKWEEIHPNLFKDPFGVIWDRRIDKDIGNVLNCILQDKKELDRYRFPSVLKRNFSHLENFCQNNRNRFIVFSISFSFFERAWILRGMENLLMDMVEDSVFVDELLDRILEFNLKIIDEVSKFPLR